MVNRFEGKAVPPALIRGARQALGGLDILVNNAGFTGTADPWGVDATEWDRV